MWLRAMQKKMMVGKTTAREGVHTISNMRVTWTRAFVLVYWHTTPGNGKTVCILQDQALGVPRDTES
jgi:hypothetical protein